MGAEGRSFFFFKTFFSPTAYMTGLRKARNAVLFPHHYYITHTYPIFKSLFMTHTRPEDGMPSEENTPRPHLLHTYISESIKKRKEKKRKDRNLTQVRTWNNKMMILRVMYCI